jgi:hypothetical protein
MKLKILTALTTMFLLIACSDKESPDSNLPLAIKARNKLWVTYAYSHNGIPDNAVMARKPTFDFRTDGDLYVSLIQPVFNDTLSYQFTDGSNKLVFSRYPVSLTNRIIFTVSKITDTNFDFSVQETGSSDIDYYQTKAQ